MKVSCAAAVLLFASLAACSTPPARATLPAPGAATVRYVRVQVTEAGRRVVERVPLERYVQAAALSEFAPSSGEAAAVERMLEVQAIISRTFALGHGGRHAREGFDLCSTTHCQLYDPARLRTSRWAAAASEAVARTSGVVLWFEGVPVEALFHADCGGRTSAATTVWGGDGRPYLVSAADDGPAKQAHASWHYEIDRAALVRALNSDPRTRIGDRLERVDVVDRDPAGRAERIALRGSRASVVRGEQFRDVLSGTLGARTVRSTWFDVRLRGSTFVFSGRGFGHGVGLCQAGALARVRAGAAVPAILQHYFPGTHLGRVR